MELQGEWVMSNLISIRLDTVFVSMQDSCTDCAKHTIASEIILDAPDGTPRRRGSSGNSFPVRLEIVLIMTHDRCTICDECTIGSEIILDTNDGTPR